MISDKTYICYQGKWWNLFPWSLAILLLFGLGILVLFSYIACNKKRILTSRTFNNRFRYLFSRFRDEKVYWELFVTGRKLLISVAVIFFSGGFEMLIVLFSMLVIFISFILQIHNVPYKRPFHNIMEYIVLLSIEALLFSSLLFFVNAFPAPWVQNALGWVCIAIIIISTIIIFILIFFDFIAQWREDLQESIKTKDALKKKELESGLDPLFRFKSGRQQRLNIIDSGIDEVEKIQQKTQQETQQESGIQIQIVDQSIQKPINVQKQQQKPTMIELKEIKPKVGEVIELNDITIKKSGIEEI